MTLQFPVAPMKAAIGLLPPAGEDDRWAYEIKWDGYRTIAFVDNVAGTVRVQSSSGRDVTSTYPELAGLGSGVNVQRAVIDGEIVVFGDDGLPTFEGLQRHQVQVVFQAFDILSVDDRDVIGLPYEARRTLLADVVEAGSNWSVPGHRIGGGQELLAATFEQGLEGVMAKKLGSTYTPGRRSPSWRKVKNRRPMDVVIGGYTAGAGARSTTFGALLVGTPRPDGSLAFAGGVGTGFTQRRLEALLGLLRDHATTECPFDPEPPRSYARDATWVSPVLRAQIEVTELTNEGYVRHASFVGLNGHDLAG